jgi:hypothetical protein
VVSQSSGQIVEPKALRSSSFALMRIPRPPGALFAAQRQVALAFDAGELRCCRCCCCCCCSCKESSVSKQSIEIKSYRGNHNKRIDAVWNDECVHESAAPSNTQHTLIHTKTRNKRVRTSRTASEWMQRIQRDKLLVFPIAEGRASMEGHHSTKTDAKLARNRRFAPRSHQNSKARRLELVAQRANG